MDMPLWQRRRNVALLWHWSRMGLPRELKRGMAVQVKAPD
jgi:hypothetical protein